MQVKLISKHDQELLVNYNLAYAKIHNKPLSTYLVSQLDIIHEVAE